MHAVTLQLYEYKLIFLLLDKRKKKIIFSIGSKTTVEAKKKYFGSRKINFYNQMDFCFRSYVTK